MGGWCSRVVRVGGFTPSGSVFAGVVAVTAVVASGAPGHRTLLRPRFFVASASGIKMFGRDQPAHAPERETARRANPPPPDPQQQNNKQGRPNHLLDPRQRNDEGADPTTFLIPEGAKRRRSERLEGSGEMGLPTGESLSRRRGWWGVAVGGGVAGRGADATSSGAGWTLSACVPSLAWARWVPSPGWAASGTPMRCRAVGRVVGVCRDHRVYGDRGDRCRRIMAPPTGFASGRSLPGAPSWR